ncbi:arsenite methyltransferase [Halomarina ordinaria]|uniref:Arsenite methyltransferase n=1 Tax=Halomarina ordinaria TaxID=3033939 RepID=A0ABD5U5K1_9EURY|nr:arsenite methyltransferase [Halomarina sp. PSRA2]
MENADDHRRIVRERYASIASERSGCCSDDGCCDSDESEGEPGSRHLGDTEEDLNAVADGADLGLGCGNPTALAALSPGERVLDMGSGAGFDCFLAAQAVGEEGHVVGVDMTPEMVERARENGEENGATNVEFRLGEIEHLPVADGSVDVVVSNCVVNLSPAKEQVFEEAFRALAPGGRVAISDVVRTAPIPESARRDPASLSACVAGAETVDVVANLLTGVGFEDVRIEPKAESERFIREWDDDHDPSDYLVSATVEARKPVES